jgi:hypothetical protein
MSDSNSTGPQDPSERRRATQRKGEAPAAPDSAARIESPEALTTDVGSPRPRPPALLWLLESRRGAGPSPTRVALLTIAMIGAMFGGSCGAMAVGVLGSGGFVEVLFSGFVVWGLVGAALALAVGGFIVVLVLSTSRRR